MALSNQELLQKAALTTADFGGAGEAPLTIEQVEEFLRLAITPQAMLPEVRTVKSNAATWQESKIEFGARIMKPGTESSRLAEGDRTKPTTGLVEIVTTLIRGEVPVSDEVLEDQVERAGFADKLMAMIAEAVGRDVEELFIQGDTTSGDSYLALKDGWLKLAENGSGANVYAAAADAQDYQTIFNKLLTSLPDRFKRNIQDMRYFVPQRIVEKYRDILSARGTPLGDFALEGVRDLVYQGIKIIGVPLFPIVAGTPDTSKILLSHRMNLYAGYRREVRMETFRDPREGATSFVVSSRVCPQIAHVAATAIATGVNVEP